MKLLVLLLALLMATVATAQQVFVEFRWDQPDSTVGSLTDDGRVIGRMLIPDGWIENYEIQIAAGADTTIFGLAAAPLSIAAEGVAVIPVDFNVPTAMRVRAIDKDGRISEYSPWSMTFTVDPGPSMPPGQPRATRVFLGG